MSSLETCTSLRMAPELWRALRHLRYLGLSGLCKHLRRRRATAWAHPRRWASKRRGWALLPDQPLSTPQETGPRYDMTVGVIADEFTVLALGYEWRSVSLTSTGWREQVEQTPIDLLFVESAWHGSDDVWRPQVIGPQGPLGHLRDVVTVLRDRGVPAVFWNKEDPAHYDEAVETARLFDWVLITDEAMVEHYQCDLGHDRIGILPFAAQPAIYSPIRLLDEAGRFVPLRDVALVGTYFAHKYPERHEQMEIALGDVHDVAARLLHGLDIFSRHLGSDDTYWFPAPWDSHVHGSPTCTQMFSTYHAYATFFSANSMVDSPSMLPCRVTEVLACGIPVVSTPTPAIDRLLPADVLAKVTDRAQAGHIVRTLVTNPALEEYMTHLAQRETWSRYTYSHRVEIVL